MKKLAIVGVSVAMLVTLALVGWPRHRNSADSLTGYITTMKLSGTPGASFNAEYVRDGKRIAFSGVLPWSMTESNLSRLEIRKVKPEDTLILDAHGGVSMVSAQAVPGTTGLRLKMEPNWQMEILR